MCMGNDRGDGGSPGSRIALSGLLERCFDGVEDVVDAQLPDWTKSNFDQQRMLGVAGATQPDPYVCDYYRDYPLLAARMPTQRDFGDNNIYVTGATKYQTTLCNHYQLSFEARVRWAPRDTWRPLSCRPSTTYRYVVVRGLLWYEATNGKFVNHDINAA
ncbi:hypothetical protein CXG81DRAFT_25443 [Caulochytrium protostelioides]|uniref:Uncharacterized protein n=1 Tax=Caulochytrium protostelioides TaxID=1555241 RepID=A0A4V1IUV5_9FUNG|nr:hypothetical protein CXG81DRAFT_25443 [Caulochytrium protostelioides]|eukprot:RKP01879.1 hypothetical protein CXG81DRAFT_25443 [Caulochytrium protostelioides]